MKIAFFELEGWEEGTIRESFPNDELFLTKDTVEAAAGSGDRDFEIVSTFVGSVLDEKTLERFPKLKMVTTRSTGYDHIDIDVCRKRGISAGYVPGYGDHTVAEFAFGLILNLMRKIYDAMNEVKERGSFSLQGLRGTELTGKTLGIIGMGRIGREMVKIAKGFEMDVIAFDVFRDEAYAAANNVKYMTIEELLSSSDIISVNCPLNEKTKHLINGGNIGSIKKGAYLVNTARGGVVETAALIKALHDGTLAGAALDVLEGEREIKDELYVLKEDRAANEELKTMVENYALMRMPNVLITPHNAFNTHEALKRILEITIKNIKGFTKGEPVNIIK